MKICAALCWYREPVEFLTRCVRSLEGVADHLVALDGAWSNFPDAEHRSTRDEELAIWEAAHVARIPLTLRTPEGVFASQVAKRSELMAVAAAHGDWILVIDGDEWVSDADSGALRDALKATDAVAGEITLVQPSGFAGGHTRRLYRAGTTVEIVHTGYTYQGRHLLTGEPTVDLTDCLTIEHDYANRGLERNAQAAEYVRRRTANREEVWV